jgi:nicotinamide-nucleotide amidase
VGDNLERLKTTLKTALTRSDFVITTGGIGPTLDDLTREAIAEVMGRPLVFQPHLDEQIRGFFQRIGRPMSPNNHKQAYIPEGAIPIENPVGTAPGFIAEQEGKAIIAVPGVPHEMRYFMEHSVLPYFRKRLGIQEIILSRVLKIFGIGESVVDETLKDLIEKGNNPTIGLLAHTQIGEIHVRLTAKAKDQDQAAALIVPLESEIRGRLKDQIFGADEETYEGVLSSLLRQAGFSLAVAETAFGSSVIQMLKMMEGSSNFFRLGLTLADPNMARKMLDLPGSFFQDQGLNSAEGARVLAEGIRNLSGADLGLGLTGRAGQTKEQDHLVYIALAHSGGTECREQRWPLAMRFIENRATKTALALVRKHLLNRAQEVGHHPGNL